MSDVQADKPKQIGTGTTNSRDPGKSTVAVKVPAEAMAFLRPETGEVIIVPAEDANLLRSHYNSLSDMVAEMHSANNAVQLCEENLLDLQQKKASAAEIAQGNLVHGLALDWQANAHDKLHTLFEGLAPVSDSKAASAEKGQTASSAASKPKEDKHTAAGAGHKLVELISLKADTEEERKKKKAEDKEGKIDDGTYKKSIASIKTSAELKKLGKWPKTMPEKLVYVRSDKLKPKWPKLKDVEKTKWTEVYKKDSAGKRNLDKTKLHTYVKEQIAKQTTITPKKLFGEDLKGGASLTLTKWADNWNTAHQLKLAGPVTPNGTQVADIELAADAQLMRFTYGGSLDGDLSVMDRRLSVKSEGHAAVDFAKAEASLDLFYPRKDGWLWTVEDNTKKQFNLIAGRCRITVEVSALVGASIAGELAMKVEVSALANTPPKVSGKPGRKGTKARKKRTVSINTNDEADVGTLDASASAFAGVRADAAITGALEWRDPGQPEREFEEIANICPSGGVQAGIGVEAKFKIDYIDGVFRVAAHASLCIGVGADGALSFAVGLKQIALFLKCLFYNIAYWQFKNLEIISTRAFTALKEVLFLAVQTGQTIETYYGMLLPQITSNLDRIKEEMSKAEARLQLANRILAKPETLRYSPPETKGMLIYQLMRHSYADVAVGGSIAGDNYLGPQRKAVLAVFKTAVTKSEATNIVQHIGKDGEKSAFESGLKKLMDFFMAEAPHDIKVPFYKSPYPAQFNDLWDRLALDGDFKGWYQALDSHLMDEVPHGYALADATSPAYEVLRGTASHPLFASSGFNAYYTTEA